ncbi:beta-galactosidase [Paenibacillus tarimensis]
MKQRKLPKIYYGGDYNPEQWPKETWDEDMRLFKLAGIDMATINVFSWAYNQPDEHTYRFDWLDEIMDKLYGNGIYVCLATGTAAHPAWMARKYPDVLITDFEGRKRKYGIRHNSCPNSPTFRRYSRLMAGKLAERYKDHPSLALWHVNNEYGWSCYCDNCERAFREWLKRRYGTLEELNRVWNTRFWGHTFYDWEEIVLPNALSEQTSRNKTTQPGISLDYNRFSSDSLLDSYREERDAIKAVIPDAVVTTNFQSNGTFKPLDYFKWAEELDVIALDSYPTNDMSMSYTAMRLDLMRGLKNGKPFLLMEQTPNQLNWKPQNPLKRPRMMRQWSYQAIARGAESILFFQLRRSFAGFEKFHGAVIDHAGHEHTRVFRECAEVGEELKRLGDTLLDAGTDAKVAIIFDWENWWALEYSSGLSADLKYLNEVQNYYDAFFEQNIQVDVVGIDTDLSEYRMIVAPALYMVKQGYAGKLEAFVTSGGVFLTTCFSGLVDENDHIQLGGYPGKLRELLGIWVEEIDAVFPNQKNSIAMRETLGSLEGEYNCGLLCDILHAEGAEVLAEYGGDFYKGGPVLTRNRFGRGEAWYIGTCPERSFLKALAASMCEAHGIRPVLTASPGVEVTRRVKDGVRFTFILNHRDEPATLHIGDEPQQELLSGVTLQGVIVIPAHDVFILQGVSEG